MNPPQTYDDWLALTPEEQHRVHSSVWNVYEGDGVALAHMAATRLAMSTTRKVIQIATGMYHGGEHVIHLTVSEEDIADCPAMLEQTFEGFRVIWFSGASRAMPREVSEQIRGTWVSEEDFAGAVFKVEPTPTGAIVTGRIPATGEELAIGNVVFMNDTCLSFTAFGQRSGYNASQVFRLVGADRCECFTTMMTHWRRVPHGAPSSG